MPKGGRHRRRSATRRQARPSVRGDESPPYQTRARRKRRAGASHPARSCARRRSRCASGRATVGDTGHFVRAGAEQRGQRHPVGVVRAAGFRRVCVEMGIDPEQTRGDGCRSLSVPALRRARCRRRLHVAAVEYDRHVAGGDAGADFARDLAQQRAERGLPGPGGGSIDAPQLPSMPARRTAASIPMRRNAAGPSAQSADGLQCALRQ